MLSAVVSDVWMFGFVFVLSGFRTSDFRTPELTKKEKLNKKQRMAKNVLAFQGKLAKIFDSALFQGFMALLILMNFILSAVQLQIHLEDSTQYMLHSVCASWI